MSWGERSCKISLQHTGKVCDYNPTMGTCNVNCKGYEWDGKTKPDSVSTQIPLGKYVFKTKVFNKDNNL